MCWEWEKLPSPINSPNPMLHNFKIPRSNTPSVVDLDSIIDCASVRSDFDEDEELPRSSSAPPMVELSAGNLFAFTADHGASPNEWASLDSHFDDVRLDPLWDEFAQSYPNPQDLPPSLNFDNSWMLPEDEAQLTTSDSSTAPHSPFPRQSPLSESSSAYSTPAIPNAVPVLSHRLQSDISAPLSHGSSLLYPNTPSHPRSTSNNVCKFWLQGNCRYGFNCHFSHAHPNTPSESSSQQPIGSPKVKRSTFVTSNTPKHSAPHTQVDPKVLGKKIFNTSELLAMASDQHGCRFLQRLLDIAKSLAESGSGFSWQHHVELLTEIKNYNLVLSELPANQLDSILKPREIVDQMFSIILPSFLDLCEDPFGNYLCQKVIEIVDEHARFAICKTCANDLYNKAQLMHGTRSVQKMVELAGPKERKIIIHSLSNHVIPLIKDLNGNHVIQKCLQYFNAEENEFIFESLLVPSNLINVANSRNGACVLQRVLDFAPVSYKLSISLEIAKGTASLVYDQFGNYALQYVLTLASENDFLEDVFPITYNHLKGNIFALSQQKFASNVCETF
ncbi:hypothetical protein GEMRC1_004383 [Eukaryota sp. GEM-RC1]